MPITPKQLVFHSIFLLAMLAGFLFFSTYILWIDSVSTLATTNAVFIIFLVWALQEKDHTGVIGILPTLFGCNIMGCLAMVSGGVISGTFLIPYTLLWGFGTLCAILKIGKRDNSQIMILTLFVVLQSIASILISMFFF